jgi:hypothetical protein
MATFEITEGAPGQGKSLYTASMTRRILRRNAKWELQGNPRRIVYSNLKFSEQFEKQWEGYIKYWTDSSELVKLHDCDIIWDEIATELDARNWVNLSIEMKRFLSQYRKRGIDIYANTQDFSMIDQRARLMISHVRTLTKVIGSRDISTTKPPPKYIWGLVMIRDVSNFRETNPEKKKYGIVPAVMLITRELVNIYDTRQDIALGKPPPLKHEVRYCEHFGEIDPITGKLHDCQFHKVFHS